MYFGRIISFVCNLYLMTPSQIPYLYWNIYNEFIFKDLLHLLFANIWPSSHALLIVLFLSIFWKLDIHRNILLNVLANTSLIILSKRKIYKKVSIFITLIHQTICLWPPLFEGLSFSLRWTLGPRPPAQDRRPRAGINVIAPFWWYQAP